MFTDLKADYIISKKQIDQFWEAGFILLKEVLNKDEIKYYGKVIRDNAKKRIEQNNFGFQNHLHLKFSRSI